MGTIRIKLLSKSSSVMEDNLEIESNFVPRVGELIDGSTYLTKNGDQVSSFIVQSVVYELSKHGLVACVTARQWYKGYRYALLQDRGWLATTDLENIEYDEDDHHL